jgi:hypothetical protein
MALFNSVHEALWWALYDSPLVGGIVAPPTFARFISRNNREQIDEDERPKYIPRSVDLERRPKGLDAAGQAALIKSSLDRIPILEVAHVYANDLKGHERVAGRKYVLRQIIKTLDIPRSNRALASTIVSRFYGRKITKREMMAKHKVTRYALNHLEEQIIKELRELAIRAETKIHDHLQGLSVVA